MEVKTNDRIKNLDLESRTETTRKFKNGLELDIKNLTMSFNNKKYDLIDIKDTYIYPTSTDDVEVLALFVACVRFCTDML